MADYRLTNGTSVIRTATGTHIPNDPNNTDWQIYLEWLAVPNTPDAADPAPAPPSNSEIYDTVILTQRVLKAVVLALNNGDIVPGGNVSGAALKAAVIANM